MDTVDVARDGLTCEHTDHVTGAVMRASKATVQQWFGEAVRRSPGPPAPLQ